MKIIIYVKIHIWITILNYRGKYIKNSRRKQYNSDIGGR